jgi:hypothetical protein
MALLPGYPPPSMSRPYPPRLQKTHKRPARERESIQGLSIDNKNYRTGRAGDLGDGV